MKEPFCAKQLACKPEGEQVVLMFIQQLSKLFKRSPSGVGCFTTRPVNGGCFSCAALHRKVVVRTLKGKLCVCLNTLQACLRSGYRVNCGKDADHENFVVVDRSERVLVCVAQFMMIDKWSPLPNAL